MVLVALPVDYGKPRPALVAQADEADALTADDCGSVVVCPLTPHLIEAARVRVAVDPTEANGLHHCSEVMVEKLAGVARARLREVVGQLDPPTMTAVERALLRTGSPWRAPETAA